METQPRQHIFNKYNTCTIVTSPVYIGSKIKTKSGILIHILREFLVSKGSRFQNLQYFYQIRFLVYDFFFSTFVWNMGVYV